MGSGVLLNETVFHLQVGRFRFHVMFSFVFSAFQADCQIALRYNEGKIRFLESKVGRREAKTT